MEPTMLGDPRRFYAEVDELSALAWCRFGNGRCLLGVGDESTDLFLLEPAERGTVRQTRIWTGYAAPKNGSNFEGVAADDQGTVVIVTEDPPGLVVVSRDDLCCGRFLSHHRVGFDEDSVRALTGAGPDKPLHPEGVLLLRKGHVLVVHEKHPRGLLELGPADAPPLGIGPSAYLRDGKRFRVPESPLHALAWWPIVDTADDVSDLAVWKQRLYVVSDQSQCIARVASKRPPAGNSVVFDKVWTIPNEFTKTEGLAFDADGTVYVGRDFTEADQPGAPNLLRFRPLP